MRLTTLLALTRRALPLAPALLASAPDDPDARRERLATLYGGFRPAFDTVRELTPAALATLLDRDEAVIVDVRSADERAVSGLPGAVTPHDVDVDAAHAAGRTVVAVCTLGVRSGAWAAERVADGVPVANLAGGLLAWTHGGGALVDPNGDPTDRLHVYGRSWNLVAEGYTGVW
ncbi:MAG: rhodanese-like domain-containing protein [Alphaproteobacteria bacterium]|nr:rhodanese-like domain-containing protein [Alphaproteobacteria bacterium]